MSGVNVDMDRGEVGRGADAAARFVFEESWDDEPTKLEPPMSMEELIRAGLTEPRAG